MLEIDTTSTPITTRNVTFTLADKVRKYKTNELIEFLRQEEDLGLDEDDLEIIRKRKIMGRDFLKTSKEEFEHCGLKMGPAKRLVDFAEECKEKKLGSFSMHLNEEIRNRIDSEDIENPPFVPEPVKIDNIIGSATGSNEAVRYENISPVGKDKAVTLVKEIVPTSHTAKLSYRDVLVKGRVDKNEDTNENDIEDFMNRRHRHQEAVWELCCKAIEAISLLPDDDVDVYDYNIDDIPDAPQEELSEAEQDKLMWESFRETHKGSRAVELFEQAFEMLEKGF
ncbi:hypothetical protein C1645_137996 [Glomus cerebriforme]|uniref:SAM domain-containing protein n=1 Tax=Glomus cerebriforme TaxID=658196 RepID=A0A397T406_9GLOM|nr:hypothetical protein C1645_137996 [Glomus cerebriforme]